MPRYEINIDKASGKSVISNEDKTAVSLPPFKQGDTLLLRIRIIDGDEYVAVTGITLKAGIGTRVGNSSDHYTEQSTWTPSVGDDPYWDGTLPMNTAEVTSAIGSEEQVETWFEVKYYEDGLPVTVMDEKINVEAVVLKDGDDIVPAVPTPLSVEVADSTYLKHRVVGKIELVCETDLTKRGYIYWGEDNEFHAEAIV